MKKKKDLLVVVDFQNDFVLRCGALAVPGVEQTMLAKMQSFLDDVVTQRVRFNDILLTFDTHTKEDYSNSIESEIFPIHCVPSQYGWEFSCPEQLDELDAHTEAFKEQNDFWKGAQLVKILDNRYFNRPTTIKEFVACHPASEWDIYICGVATDYCVKDMIRGWVARDYNVTVYRNLVAGISQNIDEVYNDPTLGQFNIINYEK